MNNDANNDKTLSEKDAEFVRERITQLRMEKGMSERSLSYALGRSSSYIKHISSGRSFPTLASLLDICECLGVTPAEFFDKEVSSPSLSRDIIVKLEEVTGGNLKQFYEIIEHVKPEFYQSLVDFLKAFKN